jgi:hypothetical protein
MPAKPSAYHDDLRQLIPQVLQGAADQVVLQRYLTERSNLPGPRMNLVLVNTFADVIGEIITQPDPPVERLEDLLDSWAALPLESAPVNDPRELLPAVAMMSYGQAAVSRPDWWHDEVTKLHTAASDPRWRIREIVATALQRMLEADWTRTVALLKEWLKESDPLVIRAAVAAIAEPRLLTDQSRGEDAVFVQTSAVEWLENVPVKQRKTDSIRTLRQALGFTVSVAAAADPDSVFVLLQKLVESPDPDLRWIARENLKKNRLTPWADKVKVLQALVT